MIRDWLRALLKKDSSGTALQHAPRPARRGSVRPRLEALEDRLTNSVSGLGSAWPSIPVPAAPGAVVVASHADPTPPPGPTAPAGNPGVGQGTPGWEALLQDVSGAAPSASTTPTASASASVIGFDSAASADASSFRDLEGKTTYVTPLAPAGPADESSSPAPGSPTAAPTPSASAPVTPSAPAAEEKAQRPAGLSVVAPPSADRAESEAAQRPPPGAAAGAAGVQPVSQPDRSGGAGAVRIAWQDPSLTARAQSSEGQSAPDDSPAAAPRVVEDRAASIPAQADAARLPARVPDDALLRRYLDNGDQAAFRTLVRRYESVVLGTCQRVLGDPHMAQEAFQATFMVLARKAGVLDACQPLAAWLCKVAFRAALRLRAAVARRRRREREAARSSAVAAPLPPDLEKKEIFQALAEELQHLPEKYRVPLALCYLDGRTHAEAAQLIGLPRGSMAKRIREGLRRLRERLAARGFIA
jgi:RNA polymerase sigma factor (sigma-70 family)